MSEGVKIFFCYAREDEEILKDLKKHLKALHWQGLIKTWYDGEIGAGAEWEQEIHIHLDEAQIILLLVSSDFIASDYCYDKEMKRAMERHEHKEARVIPIMLRPVDYSGTPFSKLQALPKDALPITKWMHRDDAFLNIAQTIRKMVEELISPVEQIQQLAEKTNTLDNNQRTTLTCQTAQEFIRVTGGSQIAYVLLEAKFTNSMAYAYKPFNIAFVMDNSSSMKGAKLSNTKKAIKGVIDSLGSSDFISVITFNDTVHKVFPSISVVDKPALRASIDRIVDGGPVGNEYPSHRPRFMSSGMLMGLNELERCREKTPNAISRMVLLTDGITSGDAESCRQLARDAAAVGIPIYPMGIGADWDEDLLDDIGQLSGGMPAEFIRNPQDALSIFAQPVQRSIEVAMRNAMLLLRLPVGVYPRKVFKVLPSICEINQSALSDRQIMIMLGDLEQSISQSILVELVIEPRREGLRRIAQAEFSFDIPLEGVHNEKIRNDITVTFTSDVSKTVQMNEQVMKYVKKTYNM